MGGDKFTFKRPENTVSIFFYAQATISVQANPRGLKGKKTRQQKRERRDWLQNDRC